MGVKRWYIPLFILFAMAFVPWVKEAHWAGEMGQELRLKYAPGYTLEQIRSEEKWVRDTERLWVRSGREISASSEFLPDNPALYWELLDRRKMLEDAMERFAIENDCEHGALEVDQRLKAFVSNPDTGIINSWFLGKFGHDAMIAAKPTGSYIDGRGRIREVPGDRSASLFLQGCLWAIPVMFLVFCVRLRAKDLLIWPELHHIAIASLVWPIGVLVYPRNLKREEQVKRAVQFVAHLASAAVGFMGFGVNMPLKAQMQPNKGGQTSSQQKRVSVSFGLEIYPTTTGINSGDMISPRYSHREELGSGFSLSGSGFAEIGERKAQLFTNNAVHLSHRHSQGMMFTTEVGGSSAGLFAQIYIRANLVKVPFVGIVTGKAMKSVVYGQGWRVRGPTHFKEKFLSWASKELPIGGGLTVATEGFMRFRPGRIANVGQPQVLFRHKKLSHLDFLTEFYMVGRDPTVRVGVQLH
jgi:hypothetical protein